ncbi:MAG: LysR family transcriptional regulator [bacterium]
MDTELLKAFVSVAEMKSFSLAAEKMHLTQPAISKRIAQLEDSLQCKLFDRIPRAVNLTEAGQVLLPRAYQLLDQLSETRQLIDDLSVGVSGTLRLAISHHIGLHRIPAVLKTFVQAYPDVTIDVDFMDSEVAYENVLHGKFEIGVITLAPEDPPGIISHPVWDDPLSLVVGIDHPLAKKRQAKVADLSEHPAILPGMSTYTGRMINALFVSNGYTLNASMATNYLETIKMMVSVGLGWSLLPESMLDGTLKRLTCPDIQLTRKLGYIHHREKTLSRAAIRFTELLSSVSDKESQGQ